MIQMEWLLAALAFLGLETAFGSLTALWFVPGALGAFVFQRLGMPLEGQLGAFAALSLLSLVLIRPWAFFAARMAGRIGRAGEGD